MEESLAMNESNQFTRRELLLTGAKFGGALFALPIISACAAPAASVAPPSAPSSPSGPAPSATRASPARTIRLAHVAPPGIPPDLAVQRFAEVVSERSGGSLEVQLHGNSELGPDQQTFQSVQSGTIEMALTGDGIAANVVPRYLWVSVPFMLESEEQYLKVLNSPITQQLGEALLDLVGTRVLADFYRLPRQLATRDKAVLTPEDARGVKLRVPDVPLYSDAYRDLGFSTTAIPFGEVYGALQQGVVDAAEAGIDFLDGASFDEVCKQLMLTEHAYGDFLMIINEQFYQGLTDEERAAIHEGAEEATTVNFDESKKLQNQLIDEWRGAGVTVHEPETIDKAAFSRIIVEKAIPRYEGRWGAGFYEQIASQAG